MNDGYGQKAKQVLGTRTRWKNCNYPLASVAPAPYLSRSVWRSINARIAQLVEQLAFNQLVLGS
ncbi:MAG: hypothetical protein WCS43_18900, partial [Verrucomicrobiota bacterium]